MQGYVAFVGTAPDVVSGDYCDLAVIAYHGDGKYAASAEFTGETTIRTDHPDVLGVIEPDAEAVLLANGWRVTSDWAYAGNSLYADVERA